MQGRCHAFFSPSGYESVIRNPGPADHVFYLPWDTPRNARDFIDAVRPEAALFMVSEYWHNYLNELHSRGIPTYLISALIRKRLGILQVVWRGLPPRPGMLQSIFFTADMMSLENLHRLGNNRAALCGDPLFDNAASIAASRWNHPVLDSFCGGKSVFIAGSVSDRRRSCHDHTSRR